MQSSVQIMSAQMEIDRNNQEEEKRKRLANRCFQDIPYLTRFPLVNPCAVLDYFSHSPFFDPSSNNQRLIMQGMLQSMENLEAMRTGLEFVVNESLSRPPNLFVIQKQNRKSPKQAESVEVYYCLNGSIFQSPDLLEVIRCRFAKIVTSLGKAHDCLFEEDTEVHD